MSEWQPIETAPTDGHTYVLLWWRNCPRPFIGHYVSEGDLGESCFKYVKHGWITERDQCVPRNQKDCTHWMPLPEPPPMDDLNVQ